MNLLGALLLQSTTHHEVDWTKVKSLEELTVALNALQISVSSNSFAFGQLKHLLKEEQRKV